MKRILLLSALLILISGQVWAQHWEIQESISPAPDIDAIDYHDGWLAMGEGDSNAVWLYQINQQGSAYWGKITCPNTSIDGFGRHISIDNGRMAVSVWSPTQQQSHTLYVYEWDGTDWVPDSLSAPTSVVSAGIERMGYDVRIQDSIMVVLSESYEMYSNTYNASYFPIMTSIYELDATGWQHQHSAELPFVSQNTFITCTGGAGLLWNGNIQDNVIAISDSSVFVTSRSARHLSLHINKQANGTWVDTIPGMPGVSTGNLTSSSAVCNTLIKGYDDFSYSHDATFSNNKLLMTRDESNCCAGIVEYDLNTGSSGFVGGNLIQDNGQGFSFYDDNIYHFQLVNTTYPFPGFPPGPVTAANINIYSQSNPYNVTTSYPVKDYQNINYTYDPKVNPVSQSQVLVYDYYHVNTGDTVYLMELIEPEAAITGRVYSDNNGNGVFDAGDQPMPNQVVTVTDTPVVSYTKTDSVGKYFMTVSPDSVLVDYLHNSQWVNSYAPSNGYDTLPVANDTLEGLDFIIDFVPANDVFVFSSLTRQPSPGFDNSARVVVGNAGTQTVENITTTVDFDQDFSVQITPPAASLVSGNTYDISIDSLQPGESNTYFFSLGTLTSAQIFDTLYISSTAEPALNDSLPANNTHFYSSQVVASYDPNNKLLLNSIPGTADKLHYTDSIVDYVINFQNEGNADAIFIEILDTLPPELQGETVFPITGSHEYSFSVINDSILKWRFDDINLPPKSVDEAGSQGYVLFAVQRDPALQIGDSFKNRAGIYFDFNAPVITEYMDLTIDQVVDSSSLLSTALCADDGVNLIVNPYNDSARTFTVELSDASGSFANATTVGTFTGTDIDLTLAQLGLSAGAAGYRLRAFSGNPLAEAPVASAALSVSSPAFSVDTTNATNATTADGSVTITATAGSIDSVFWAFDNSTLTSLTRTDLLPGTYAISVYDANGCAKDTTVIVGSKIISSRTELNTLGARLYPNPADEKVMLQVPTTGTLSVTIISTTGQRVFESTLGGKTNYDLSLSNLAKGVYLVKVTSDAGQLFQRLVKE